MLWVKKNILKDIELNNQTPEKNKPILINNAIINLNLYSEKNEININKGQVDNTIKNVKDSLHSKTLKQEKKKIHKLLSLIQNKKFAYPKLKLTNTLIKDRQKTIGKYIHYLKTDTNVSVFNNFKVDESIRNNKFFRLKINNNLKFNSIFKK